MTQEEINLKSQQILQNLVDTFGYISIVSRFDLPIGHREHNFTQGPLGHHEADLIIIGKSTLEEFVAQLRFLKLYKYTPEGANNYFYYRAIAE